MYLDSCVILKLVTYEPDSEAYNAIVTGEAVVTSELAVAEIRSALFAKERAGRITREARMASWRAFQDRIREQEIVLLPLNRQVIERAGAVIEQCAPVIPLRTLDAIHVATAELHGGEAMCSSDERVCEASDYIGLAAVPRPPTK
ncbi:MAG TPA: type II toxin-antitoxin system VapC family toxin [Verrucomicrobiae bacterium]|nr:type II toxin-antitoxin system VapC family toxin [Verrucomicrobiae bacterium]